MRSTLPASLRAHPQTRVGPASSRSEFSVLGWALICALVACSSASAQSTVSYTVEIGGDPGVAGYEALTYPQYVRGSNLDGQTVAADNTVNWGVVATVSGLHSGAVGNGFSPQGIANAVFTLELKDSAGVTITTLEHTANAATTAGWYSVINDGDADGVRGSINGADPLQNAAFPSVFNIGGFGANGGRLFDLKASGGPKMDFYHYPSATGLAVMVNGNPVQPVGCNGKLVGMGAGYSAFLPLAAAPNTGGVGLTGTVGGCVGLGEKVLFEGQLSLKGLAGGTYTLAVTGGSGTTIMPYAANRCGLGSPAAFAAAPNQITNDEIAFIAAACCGPCPPLQVVNAVSRKTHGTFGSYDIPAGQVECRTCGLHKLIVVFNQNIELLSGTNSVVPGCGTVVSVAVSGNVLTVFLSGVTDAMPCTIEFPGICSVCNGNQRTTAILCWRYLIGDVNGNGVINNSDIILARGALGMDIASFNFRRDVNCNGVMNNSDIILIRGNLGKTVAPCPQ